MNKVIEALKKMGFREYEAGVYVTFASKKGDYEIHKLSGVPRTKVYEVLRTLESKGFVETVKSSPASFRAIDPEKVFEEYKQDFVNTVDTVIKSFREAKFEEFVQHPVWCVHGSAGVKNRAKTVIQEQGASFDSFFCHTL